MSEPRPIDQAVPAEGAAAIPRPHFDGDQSFYKALLDNLSDGVYFVDRDRRITYWNRGAELLSGYASGDVVGTCCQDNLLRHVTSEGKLLCTDGCPLTATLHDGLDRQEMVYLHHKNGQRLPVRIRVSPVRNASGEITGALEVFSDDSAHAAAIEMIDRLRKDALHDLLTGVGNRRYCDITLKARLAERERFGWPFAVLILDVDRFKSINDQFGHPTGDSVLAMVAATLVRGIRPLDFVGRWGGDEFIVVLANITGSEVHSLADRLRMLVERSSFSAASGHVGVTVSVGATIAGPVDTEESLVDRADILVYQSKQRGRNCVTADCEMHDP